MSILTELFHKLLRQSPKKFTLLNHVPLFLGPFSTPRHPPPEHGKRQAGRRFISRLRPHFFNPSLLLPPPLQQFSMFGSLHILSKLGHRTRTPAWPKQVSTAMGSFPSVPHLLDTNTPLPPISVAQKDRGHFYGSNSVTTAKLHAAAFVRGRLRVNGKTITLLLSPQTLQFMKSRSENSSREEGFGREKQSCCRGLTISY